MFVVADLAFGCNECICPNAEVIEIKACRTNDPSKCSGQYALTGCDTIDIQDACEKCVYTVQHCCLTQFNDYQNNGNCTGPAVKAMIAKARSDKELMSSDFDPARVLVPVCRGTYMSLDQVILAPKKSRGVIDAKMSKP